MFVSNVMKLSPVLALAVLAPLWSYSLSAQMRSATIGPMTVNIPPEWTPIGATNNPNLAAFLAPQQARVAFSAEPDGGASAAESHRVVWQSFVAMMSAVKQQRSGQFGRYHWSEMLATGAQSQRDEITRVYSTKQGNVRVVAYVSSASPQEYANTVVRMDQVLTRAIFGDVNPVQSPATPTVESEVPITEIHTRIEMRGVSFGSNMTTDHIIFFANGVVAREGVINGRPRECYALYQPGGSQLPRNYGRWQEQAGTVSITWQEGPAWTLKREEGRRLSLDGRKLLAYRPVDGARIEGQFVYGDVGGVISAIALSSDGRFVATTLREGMGCPATQPGRPAGVPESGSGTYEIRKWTLILRFANGAVGMYPFHVETDQDLARPARFWLNSYSFELKQ